MRLSRAWVAGLILLIVIISSGCSTSNPTPPPVEKEAIIVTVNGNYDFTGQALSGSVTVTGNGANVSGAIGSPLNLGDYTKGASLPFTIKLYADGGHPFFYNSVSLSGTSSITGLKALPSSQFPIGTFVSQMTTDGVNSTCTSPSINGLYSTSFTSAHVFEFTTQIEKVAGWMGKPCTVSSKDMPETYMPASGEYGSIDVPGFEGLASSVYPKNGTDVTSGVMMYDQTTTAPVGLIREVVKLFKQNGVTMTGTNEATLAKFFSFACTMRPQGTNQSYKIFTDHEEMTGLPSGASAQSLGTATYSTYEAMPNPANISTGLLGDSDENYDWVKTGERRREDRK